MSPRANAITLPRTEIVFNFDNQWETFSIYLYLFVSLLCLACMNKILNICYELVFCIDLKCDDSDFIHFAKSAVSMYSFIAFILFFKNTFIVVWIASESTVYCIVIGRRRFCWFYFSSLFCRSYSFFLNAFEYLLSILIKCK